MISMASQITGVSIVYSTLCSGADQRKHQSSASLAFVRGIHRWPVDSPHKGPVTRKMFPLDDVITIFFLISLPSWRYHPSASVHTLFPRWRILPEWTSWWPPGFSLDLHLSWSPREPLIFPPSSSPSSWRLKGMRAYINQVKSRASLMWANSSRRFNTEEWNSMNSVTALSLLRLCPYQSVGESSHTLRFLQRKTCHGKYLSFCCQICQWY